MLFRKKITKSCAYCIHSAKIGEAYLCSKKGIRTEEQRCFRFKYDPTKRIPKKAKALDFSEYNDRDFSL